jgi:hypothetical protein
MALPYARSIAEEHLYMELHPCRCGESTVTASTHGSMQAEQGLASEHTGRCTGCGEFRRFVFRLPGLAPQHTDRYGGPDPSQIIDAGEWRMVSLAYLGHAQKVRDRPDELRRALEEALAAYQEMMKFIPPGDDEIPDSAFFTERGRRVRAKEPGNPFHRRYLTAMIDGVRKELVAIR